MPPFVSVVVPVKNEHRYISECVASLLNLDYLKESYEIIVALDRNATDAVKSILKTYKGKITVLQSKKAGSAANRNLGAANANKKAKYLAFTDADCVVDKAWLMTLANRMEEIQTDERWIGVIGGLNLVPKSDNKLAKTLGAMEQTLFGGGGSAQVAVMKEEQLVHSLPNCNALYKKRLWQENKQDENFIVGQDGEFNYRLYKKGVRFLAIPDAIVWHHRTNSWRGFIKRMFRYGEATARIFKKHKEPEFLKIRWYGVVPVFALILLIALIVLSFYSSLALYSLGLLAGFYAIADIMTAITVIEATEMNYSLVSLVLLPLQHFLYAVGFIFGLFR